MSIKRGREMSRRLTRKSQREQRETSNQGQLGPLQHEIGIKSLFVNYFIFILFYL